jgi:RNA polymerase sigma factor (sigma-70 family)
VEIAADVVKHARDGNRQALEALSRWAMTIARGRLRGRGVDHRAIEDLSQECIVRLLRALKHLRHDDRLGSLFRMIIDNVVVDYYRKKNVDKKMRYIAPGELARMCARCGNRIELRDESVEILSALRTLPRPTRRLFFLLRALGSKPKEIARRLGISLSAVKRRKVKLAESLDRLLGGRK